MAFHNRHLTIPLLTLLFLTLYLLLVPHHPIFPTDPFTRTPHPFHSPQTNWYNRSTPITDPTSHHLNLSSLLLLTRYSAWGIDYFYLAFFHPNLCLTETALLVMNSTDFAGIEELVRKARDLRGTGTSGVEEGGYFNLAPNVMDTSTLEIHLPLLKTEPEKGGGKEGDGKEGDGKEGNKRNRVKEYHAYGFSKRGSGKGADVMPDVLWELFGLVVHGEMWGWKGSNGTEMKRLLGEVVEIQAEYGRRPKHYWEV